MNNTSSNAWPFAPDGHYHNRTGDNDAAHLSPTAAVYEPGLIPTPWSYTLITILISLIFAIIGAVSAASDDKDEDDISENSIKQRFLRTMRKCGIIYNVLRTILMVVKCALARHSRIIPSGATTASIGISLLGNFLDKNDDFDFYSYPVLVCPVFLWCLLWYQFSLGATAETAPDTPNIYAHGAFRILGGNCIRFLNVGENCTHFESLGCTGSVNSTFGLVSHEPSVELFEYIATWLGIPFLSISTGFALQCAFKRRHTIARYRNPDLGATPFLLKILNVNILIILLLSLAFFALDGSTKYVDAATEDGPNGSSAWIDCFEATEPSDGSGFLRAWLEQEWNKTAFAKAALFALV